jgi:hypothetical protein
VEAHSDKLLTDYEKGSHKSSIDQKRIKLGCEKITKISNDDSLSEPCKTSTFCIHAVVVTRVAGSLEARGLPGYPESLLDEINMMKSCKAV